MNRQTFKQFGLPLLVSLAMAMMLAPMLRAQEDDEFQPRSSAPPGNRTGGASRSENTGVPSVSVLATAKQVGLTTREFPAIYWYLSADTELPVMISVTPKDKKDVTYEATLAGPKKSGVHKFDFKDLRDENDKPVKLVPGMLYEIVVDVPAKKRGASQNPNATCAIQMLDPKDSPTPPKTAGETDPAKLAAVYAKEGIWFDFLDALNAAIEKTPDDESLVKRRAKALESQGLIWQPDGKIVEKSEKPAGGAGEPAK